MAKNQYIGLTVPPIFSLDDIPKESFSKEAFKLKRKIQRSLKRKENDSLTEQTIFIGEIPGDITKLAQHRKEHLEVFAHRFQHSRLAPACTPYLIGLLSFQEFLIPRMKGNFIESFVYPNPYTFKNVANHDQQICLRRVKDHLVIDVSVYIRHETVNYNEGFSPYVISGIYYQKETEDAGEEEEENVEPQDELPAYLGGKMIG